MPYTHFNILLAEDDPDDQYLFTEALDNLDIRERPVLLGNGQEVLNYLRQAIVLPDLIFLDINMPIKDGLTALSEIRAMAELKDLPVIVFSTTASPTSVETAWKLGATRYATKPSGFEPLVLLLKTIFSQIVEGTLPSERDYFVFK